MQSHINVPCNVPQIFVSQQNYIILGYVPNLSYGRNKSTKKRPKEFLQDEHNCLKHILDQFVQLKDGFWTQVMGQSRRVIPFIYIMNGRKNSL